MARMKQSPRYNVISVRISDDDFAELVRICDGRDRSKLMREALSDYMIRQRQMDLDEQLRAHGV
jgi:predicted transcriptional regulator